MDISGLNNSEVFEAFRNVYCSYGVTTGEVHNLIEGLLLDSESREWESFWIRFSMTAVFLVIINGVMGFFMLMNGKLYRYMIRLS